MPKDYHLILAPLTEVFPKKKNNLLLLGKWCEIGTKISSKRRYEIINYPWSRFKKKEKDYKEIFKNYEFFKRFLTKYLNKAHKTNYSEKYWEQIFGNWLIIFLTVLQDKIEVIKKLKNYKIKKYTFINLDEKDYIPKDSFSSLYLFQNDYWNGFFYSILINYFYPKINYDVKNFKLKIEKNTSNRFDIKNFIKNIIYKFSFKINKNKYFIISTYLGFLNELILQIFLNKSLNINKSPIFSDDSKIDCTLRLISKAKYNKLSKLELIQKLIIKFIPQIYLEGHETHKKFIKDNVNWEKKPKKIFTSNSHFYDDTFKTWSAEKREQGTEFIVGQHGNGYIFPKFTSFFDRDIKSCDKFLFWGNKKFKEKKILNNFNIITVKNKNLRKKNRNILLVQYFPYKYQNRIIATEHTLFDINENINLQKNFILGLKEDIKSNVVIRLGSTPIYSNGMLEYEKKQWKIFKNHFSFEDRLSPIKKSIENANFIVVNSIVSSVFTECLHYNIPCFIFQKFEKKMFRRECYNDFLNLKKIGIIQNNPKNFSKFINNNFYNLDNWWNSYPVKKIIDKFNYNYNYKESDPLTNLAKKFN